MNLKISGVGAVGKAKGRDVGGCSEKQGENFQILILVVSFTKKHFVRDKKVSYIALASKHLVMISSKYDINSRRRLRGKQLKRLPRKRNREERKKRKRQRGREKQRR